MTLLECRIAEFVRTRSHCSSSRSDAFIMLYEFLLFSQFCYWEESVPHIFTYSSKRRS